jgi:hypothetical protein
MRLMSDWTISPINGAGDAPGTPWAELGAVERALAELVAERPDATVRQLAGELTRLRESLARTRETLEAVAGRARERRQSEQLERVVDALLPAEVPPPAAVWHAQRSAEARLALVREWGAWSAAELADRAGSTAGNRSALASAWRTAGRVIALDWNGRSVFPAFQFGADGHPRPVIAAVLGHLRRAGLSDWQAALWFTNPTGWLEDQRPVDVLEDDPAAVENAAARFDQRPS